MKENRNITHKAILELQKIPRNWQFIDSHVKQVPINTLRERTGERDGQRKQINKYHFVQDHSVQEVFLKH